MSARAKGVPDPHTPKGCQQCGHPFSDPIDAVTALGIRVVWVLDFPAGIVLVDEEQLVIADADLDRQTVADAIMAVLSR